MTSIPEYGTITNPDELQTAFFSYLDEMKDNVSNFILTNKTKISNIYTTIKDGGAKKMVNVIDLNLLFHSYKDYLEDMIKFITSDDVKEKCDASNDEELSGAILKMREMDKKFFDNVATSESEKISDAMRNIEILIDMKEFIQNIRKKFMEINSKERIEFIQLMASSVSTFYDKLLQAVMNSLEIIQATMDGTLAQSNPNKEIRYKMF